MKERKLISVLKKLIVSAVILGCAAPCLLPGASPKNSKGPAPGKLPAEKAKLISIVERNIDIFEKRFFTRDKVLLDYAGLNGEVILPTPEECALNKPNALAWVTPIENGAMFNGILLPGVLNCWKKAPSPKLADFARDLLKGLFSLQDKSPVPGCILRGVGSDGKCHYPGSSNDQVVPFLLGLWEFANSPLATPEERKECRQRCYTVVKALEKNKWVIPGAKPGFERGSLRSNGTSSNCHLLLAAIILDEMEGGNRVEKILQDPKKRKSIAKGFPKVGERCGSWYACHNYYIMRMLVDRVKGEAEKKLLRDSIHLTALEALPALKAWKNYKEGLKFDPDWRIMNKKWYPQKNCKEAASIPGQSKLYKDISPAYMNEHLTIMIPLSSAWMGLFTKDEKVRREVIRHVLPMIQAIPYEKLYCSTHFYVINVISELL